MLAYLRYQTGIDKPFCFSCRRSVYPGVLGFAERRLRGYPNVSGGWIRHSHLAWLSATSGSTSVVNDHSP